MGPTNVAAFLLLKNIFNKHIEDDTKFCSAAVSADVAEDNGMKDSSEKKIQPKMSVFLASSETLKFSVLIQTCSCSAAHPLCQISSSSAHMYIYYIISFYKGNTMQFHTIWQSVPGYNKWSLMKMLNSESFFIIQWNWICDFLGFYSHMALRWKFTRLSRFWIYS